MVLVVEDEQAIREAVQDILAIAEIQTLLAANGKQGIELFTRHRQEVKAVLLDMRMPVMSGAETYEKLRQIDPNVNIILSTGYDDSELLMNFQSDDSVTFLRKPYAVDTLLSCVQEAIEQ